MYVCILLVDLCVCDMYMYVCIYIYICIHVCMYVCMYVYMYACICVCMYPYCNLLLRWPLCIFLHVHMYLNTYIYMQVHTYIYIRTYGAIFLLRTFARMTSARMNVMCKYVVASNSLYSGFGLFHHLSAY